MTRYRYLLLGSLFAAAGCATVDDDAIEDGSDELASVDQEVVNGSTDFTDLHYQEQRTVGLRTPTGGICSGTLVLPNVVMTARHCVTTDSTIRGPLAAASSVRARIVDFPVAPVNPPGVDLCDGAGRDETCSEGARIQQINSTTDIVFVGLANPLALNGNATLFTPLELSNDLSSYLNDQLRVSGWGRNTCSGGSGTLRWGLTKVEDVDDTQSIDGDSYSHLLRKGSANNQNTWKGDSGGPTWGTRTYPAPSLGALSGGICTTLSNGNSQAEDSWAVPVANFLTNVRTLLVRAANKADFTDQLTSFNGLTRVDVRDDDEAPNWQIVDGHIKQTANAGDNIVLVRTEIAQRLAGGSYSVKVSSSDNDAAGVVFSYVNTKNYMTCEVNAQSHLLSATYVRNGERTVLASKTWNGDYSPAVTITANLIPIGSNPLQFPIGCSVSGGGVATVSLSTTHTVMPAGRVGVFNDFLDEAVYSSFVVTQADATLPNPNPTNPNPPDPNPPGHQCGSGQKCCEPAIGGGCDLCFDDDLTCP